MHAIYSRCFFFRRASSAPHQLGVSYHVLIILAWRRGIIKYEFPITASAESPSKIFSWCFMTFAQATTTTNGGIIGYTAKDFAMHGIEKSCEAFGAACAEASCRRDPRSRTFRLLLKLVNTFLDCIYPGKPALLMVHNMLWTLSASVPLEY